MNGVRITDARQIAERVKAEAVVIIAFGGDSFSITSYGATKAKCAATGKWVDDIAKKLASGALDAPAL